MSAIRRPLKFTTLEGATLYEWPRWRLEYDATQPLELPTVRLTGADYDFDLLGDAPARRGNGLHTLRYMLLGQPEEIDDHVDNMRAGLYLGARGYLYLEAATGALRRAVARITAIPEIRLGTRDRTSAPVIVTFSQYGDFQDAAPIDEHEGAVQEVAGDPDTLTVTNPGNAPVLNAIVTIKGVFAGLRLVNTSALIPGSLQAYAFETDREGASLLDWLRIDAGANRVEFSDDAGASWADDSANVVLQDGQVALWAMAPGANLIDVEGADGAIVEFEFAGGWI